MSASTRVEESRESPSTTRGSGRKPRPLDRKPVQVLLPLLVLGTFIGGWELASEMGLINPITVPPASETFTAALTLYTRDYFWHAAWVTLQETLLGFALGASAGLIIGALTGTFKVFRVSLYPFIVAFQNAPRVALAPIFLTWFGFGMTSKVVMAAVICFFPAVINTIAGIASVDENAKVLFRTFGATTNQTFFRLTVPSAAAVTFAGIKTALTLALLGAIVAEFVGGAEGLGVLINEFNFQLQVAMGLAVVINLAMIGLILYGLIELLERRLITWAHR